MNQTIDFRAPVGWQCRQNRLKVFVDLENACGGSQDVFLHEAEIRRMVNELGNCVPCQVTLSVGPLALQNCPNLIWAWGSARFLPGKGLDGADLALLDAIKTERLRPGLDTLVLISGDHIFTNVVEKLTSSGVRCIVVARPNALSSKLKFAATRIQYINTNKEQISKRKSA